MALPIDVSSIDALRFARETLILFTDDAQGALGAMESEIRRCVDWLTHDQRMYWQSEVKRREQALAEAKAELHRKQLSQMFGGESHDSEQREAVRNAKRKLEDALDKVELVKDSLPVLERAVMEYQTQAHPFADLLEFDAKRSTEMIDRMIGALEDYIRETAPQSGPAPKAEVLPVTTVAAPRVVVPDATVPPATESTDPMTSETD